MRTLPFVAVAGLAFVLAACGTNPADRAISGAGIGAGAGLLVDEPVAGALVGGAAGALIPPDQVNLGRPIWR
jgi:osmotically inducible lipoprotein OsmB